MDCSDWIRPHHQVKQPRIKLGFACSQPGCLSTEPSDPVIKLNILTKLEFVLFNIHNIRCPHKNIDQSNYKQENEPRKLDYAVCDVTPSPTHGKSYPLPIIDRKVES